LVNREAKNQQVFLLLRETFIDLSMAIMTKKTVSMMIDLAMFATPAMGNDVRKGEKIRPSLDQMQR
jgi:hypothetical protein